MKKAFALSMVIGIAVIMVIVLVYESSLDVIGEDEARDVIVEFAGYGKLGVTDIENLVEISNMVKSEAEAYNFTPEHEADEKE